jgi:WD40 repeat protein
MAHAPSASSPEIFLQLGHNSGVKSVVWSPDGKTLATGGYDNTLKLWDAASGQQLRTQCVSPNSIDSETFSPDGRTLAAVVSTYVELWDVASGRELRMLSGHRHWVLSVAWSRDGKTLATGSLDKTAKLWDPNTGSELRTLTGHSSSVNSVAWSRDGKTLATGSSDNTVKLWDASSGREIRTLSSHSDVVNSVAWSPIEDTLASASGDGTVRLWDAVTGKELRVLRGHSSSVNSVAWSRDGKTLATGSSDNTVKLWDAASGGEIRTLRGHSNSVTSVAWSPNENALASASGDSTVKLWDAVTGKELRALSSRSVDILSLAWSPNDGTLASASGDGTVRLWDAVTGKELRALGVPSGYVESVAWSPDGSTLAIAAGVDGTVRLWNTVTGKEFRVLNNPINTVWTLAWSPDGKTLATANGNDVRLWEAGNGRVVRTLTGHFQVESVAWSRDGKTLAIAAGRGGVTLWDAAAGRIIVTLRTSDWIRLAVWSPDGSTLAIARNDGTLELRDAVSWRYLRLLTGQSNFVGSVAWSPDGNFLASASGNDAVKLWDVASGVELRTLRGQSGYERSVAWSRDGKTLATGGPDGTMRLWDPATGELSQCSTILPKDEWFSQRSGFLPFVASSKQAAGYAAVRFDNQLRPVFPLSYYYDELHRDDLQKVRSEPPPGIKPKPIRYAWENFQDKRLWFGGAGLLYFTALTVTLVLAYRIDPSQTARQFFSKAGFERVELGKGGTVLLSSKEGRHSLAVAVVSPHGPLDRSVCPEKPEKTYVIYMQKEPPSNEFLQSLRTGSYGLVIPLLYTTLARAVDEDVCQQTLRELEEPFTVRSDPYDESRPISDPTWFYGRNELLDELPAVLRQGQHVGLFGLRKVGKTSLINQLRSRLSLTPTVWIDCQGYSPKAEDLLHAILEQLRDELRVRKIRGLGGGTTPHEFRREFLGLHELWSKSHRDEPFILILDEADKLFPDRRINDSERILGEWVSLFRILRALAQERKCVSVMVTAYRPDLNRQNLLSPSIGENPMFMSFQEYFLGSIEGYETETMVREIGAWKDIHWSVEALKGVYRLCGGHPLVTRIFASDTCEQGNRKEIDQARVTETASAICAQFHKHRIGRYYKESVWDFLLDDERQALELVLNRNLRLEEVDVSEAVTHLEQFGLIRNQDGIYEVSAQLLRDWLERS